MIRHTLIFRLHRPVDDNAREAFLAAVREFGANPPHALAAAVVSEDLVLRPEGRSSSEGMLEVTFADAAAFRAYLADERHVAFVEKVLAPWADWLSTQTDGAKR
jgi:hypothetical protein